MKTKIPFLKAGLSVVTAILILSGAKAVAVTPPSAVREAYAALAVANNDYDGHRVEAMKEVQMAARGLGMDLSGKAHGRETKGQADDHLRYAKSMLQQARAQLSDKNNGRTIDHINAALKEINTALKVK